MRQYLWLLSILTLFSSCGNDRLPKVEVLEGFRIIGIEASNPEVAPGGSSNLRVYVSDPQGGGRIINGSYVACVDPGISLGAAVDCSKVPGAVSGSYTIDTTPLSGTLYTGFSGTMTVNIPAGILTGRSAREQFNGVGYIVIFTFTVDGKTVRSFKRVLATSRGSLNSNPATPTILLNGSALSSVPREGDNVSVTGLTPETYQFQNVDGTTETRTESLEVAWFMSTGEVNRPKAQAQDSAEFTEAPGPNFLILSAIRDGRGGFSVQRNYIP